jgi:hypothetical protein
MLSQQKSQGKGKNKAKDLNDFDIENIHDNVTSVLDKEE